MRRGLLALVALVVVCLPLAADAQVPLPPGVGAVVGGVQTFTGAEVLASAGINGATKGLSIGPRFPYAGTLLVGAAAVAAALTWFYNQAQRDAAGGWDQWNQMDPAGNHVPIGTWPTAAFESQQWMLNPRTYSGTLDHFTVTMHGSIYFGTYYVQRRVCGVTSSQVDQQTQSQVIAIVESVNNYIAANCKTARPTPEEWLIQNPADATPLRDTILSQWLPVALPSAMPAPFPPGISLSPQPTNDEWTQPDPNAPVSDPNANPDGSCKSGYARGAGYTCQVDTDGNGIPDWQEAGKTEEPITCPAGYTPNQTSRQCLLPPFNTTDLSKEATQLGVRSELQSQTGLAEQQLAETQLQTEAVTGLRDDLKEGVNAAGACQQLSSQGLLGFFTNFWPSLEKTGQCLLVPTVDVGAKLQATTSSLQGKFPFSVAAALSFSDPGGTGQLPTTFGMITVDWSDFASLWALIKDGAGAVAFIFFALFLRSKFTPGVKV